MALSMQNTAGGRAPFGVSAMQESEIKEKFYRYFQEEVIGEIIYFLSTFLSSVVLSLMQNYKIR